MERHRVCGVQSRGEGRCNESDRTPAHDLGGRTGVSDLLGNTPAVARRAYIDPRVFDRYLSGWTITVAGAQELSTRAERARRRVELAFSICSTTTVNHQRWFTLRPRRSRPRGVEKAHGLNTGRHGIDPGAPGWIDG